MRFEPLGQAGQRALRRACAMIVGVGGIGTWTAELLARAGVGALRLVDGDVVELVNIHRQGLFEESDAAHALPKPLAAVRRLKHLNSQVAFEPVCERLAADNIDRIAAGADIILDGSDNYLVRYVINDYCVLNSRPWVFAGALATEGQVMPVLPDRTACLRCVLPTPAPPCTEPSCRVAGAMGPAVAAIAAIQAAHAIRILSGQAGEGNQWLLKLDLWTGAVQRVRAVRDSDCPCCGRRHFEYLHQ